MNTTHDDNATTWRDLADQLTDKQIARLTSMESRAPAGWAAGEAADALLNGAREYAEQNLMGTVVFGHIATPAAAREVFPWEDDGHGEWSRFFYGTRYTTAGQRYDVETTGVQRADGSVKRAVYINAPGDELTAKQAREAAALLIQAADELDRLAV